MTITEEATRCPDCNEIESVAGVCLNVECARAIRQATIGAARSTHKATATAVSGPAAWTQSGNVD